MAESPAAKPGILRGALFAQAKFQPPALPDTLVTRSVQHEWLAAGASKRLTVVVGSAGAGKSVLLASWAAARPPGVTSWLTADKADANPIRFWTGFIEALRVMAPGFGADAADLLALNGAMSADVTAAIANDAAQLPPGSAIIVDDFHAAAAAVSEDMANLVRGWPAGTAQLVLASRFDPPLRLHRLRMADELCELRDRDLRFSLAECRDLLANFGVQVSAADLAVLHQRSEGWAAALQMVALSLRGTADSARVARALEIRSHAIAEYFIAEVLEQQPPEIAEFMLDTSVLGELTADACAAVTGKQNAAALLRGIEADNLFLTAADEESTSFRSHQLVRQLLHAELRARDRAREQKLQLRAAEWFESAGDTRHAIHHFLAAQQADRALALLQDRVAADFLRDPALPGPPDLSMVDPSSLADAPDQLLALAAHLLTWGDPARGGQCLDLLERAQPSIPRKSRLAARFATMRSVRHALMGQADKTVEEALAARAIQEQGLPADEWTATVPMILMSAYEWLQDFPAVEREAATALGSTELTEPVKLVAVAGARAQAWFESGHLADAAAAATAAEAEARRRGFSQHFFAVDYLRVLAGLALERRDLDTAEQLTEQALSLSERGRPAFEFLTLLDQARIWAARGQVRDALASIETARLVLAATGSVLLARADELEALLRLPAGDSSTLAKLAGRLSSSRRGLLLARIALATGDHHAAYVHLQSLSPDDLTPRHALVRQILLAAAAISRDDPAAAGSVGGVLESARHGGFLNTIVTTAPQVTSYLIEHSSQMRPAPFTQQLIAAALQVRATQPDTCRPVRMPAEPLTPAELRILKLLPTSTYLQMAATLYVSRNTVKSRLRSVYRKLGVTSRADAIKRAVDLRLL